MIEIVVTPPYCATKGLKIVKTPAQNVISAIIHFDPIFSHKIPPVVNFINILQAAFALIYFHQKIQSQTVIR